MSKMTIRPPKNTEEFSDMVDMARENNTLIFHPTHFICKDNIPVGFLTIGGAPIVGAYFNREKCKARDSFAAISIAENYMRALGHKHYSLLCETSSPFFPLLEKMGYKNIWSTNLMDKEL